MSEQNGCCSRKSGGQQKTCCGAGRVNTVLACSGASNVGQITNEVAKRLDEAGAAKFFCLAGVGGRVSGMVASVKGADSALVLDGCDVGCAKKCMDAAGLSGYEYLVVTDLDIEKKHDFNLAEADIEKTLTACRAMLATTGAEKRSGCCG